MSGDGYLHPHNRASERLDRGDAIGLELVMRDETPEQRVETLARSLSHMRGMGEREVLKDIYPHLMKLKLRHPICFACGANEHANPPEPHVHGCIWRRAVEARGDL